jgi:hypothetical protein
MFDNQPQETESGGDGCTVIFHPTSYSLWDITMQKCKIQVTQLAAHYHVFVQSEQDVTAGQVAK